MTVLKQDGHAGTNGAAVTPANSASSGDAFFAVDIAGTGAMTYSNAQTGVQFSLYSNGGSDKCRATHNFTATAQASAEFFLWVDVLPGAAAVIAAWQNTAFSNVGTLNFSFSSSQNYVRLNDNSGGAALKDFGYMGSGGTLAVRTLYLIEWKIQPGTTSTGQLECRISDGLTRTPIDSGGSTACNVGTVNIQRHQVGSNTTGVKVYNYYGSIWIDTAVYAYLGAPGYNLTVNDGVGVADLGTQQAIEYDYDTADPVGVTDAAVQALSRLRAFAESVALSDQAAAVLISAPSAPVDVNFAVIGDPYFASPTGDPTKLFTAGEPRS